MKYIKDEDYIKFIGNQESQYFVEPNHFVEDVVERFRYPIAKSGDLLPWSKTHNLVQLRDGELSIWAGINGHKKSMVLGQVAAWLMTYSSVLICSLEMLPQETQYRMVRQCAGRDDASERYIRRWHDYTTNRLWLYDQTDSVAPERILGMVYYAAKQLRIKHIIIDSLMKCGISGNSDKVIGEQKIFIDRLSWAAKSTKCHIHLVHHMRKGEREEKIPDKFDVRGAGEIVDNCHNLFIVHKNLLKEKKKRQNKEYDEKEPDGVLVVSKQRNGSWEGYINLWFHEKSLQYTERHTNSPMQWPAEIM